MPSLAVKVALARLQEAYARLFPQRSKALNLKG